jgi:hypothetical protein
LSKGFTDRSAGQEIRCCNMSRPQPVRGEIRYQGGRQQRGNVAVVCPALGPIDSRRARPVADYRLVEHTA